MECVECRGRACCRLTTKEECLNTRHDTRMAHHRGWGLACETRLAPGAPVNSEAVEVVEEEGRVVALGITVDAAEHKHVLAGEDGAVTAAGAGECASHAGGVPATKTGKVKYKEGARSLLALCAVSTINIDFKILKK